LHPFWVHRNIFDDDVELFFFLFSVLPVREYISRVKGASRSWDSPDFGVEHDPQAKLFDELRAQLSVESLAYSPTHGMAAPRRRTDSFVGTVGSCWLWWKWRKNYVWLLSRIFLYVLQSISSE
jgi:hypothetical protein